MCPGWKEQFFRWWHLYRGRIPTPRDDLKLQLAEPFDVGHRMSNLVSDGLEVESSRIGCSFTLRIGYPALSDDRHTDHDPHCASLCDPGRHHVLLGQRLVQVPNVSTTRTSGKSCFDVT